MSLVCYNIVNILYVLDYHVGQVYWPKLVFDHVYKERVSLIVIHHIVRDHSCEVLVREI